MQTELTPKQQASELIKQAQNVLILTGREPNNDQLSAAIAVQRVLNKLQKQASVVITDKLPKCAELYDTQFISKELAGVRDFIISVDMHSVVVDKLKYNVENDKLNVTITPLNGNFVAKDVSFEQGHAHFAHCLSHVIFVQSTTTAQAVKYASQPVAQLIEHRTSFAICTTRTKRRWAKPRQPACDVHAHR